MIAPRLPADEAERLADLHGLALLDTPPEERFDRIVRLAMAVFDVPIAYIALIDSDRQWFKAKCGLAADHTGRDESFCGHTILQDDALIVADARDDARFRDNPLVTGPPFIRFYAGHPLAGGSGGNVGTLCLADSRPRHLAEHEVALLRELAAVAEREISLVDLARLQRQLLETQTELAATQQRLRRELAEAARYVQTILPPPLDTAGVSVRHRFLACSELGGDMLGALPLDSDGERVALYVLDVAGHGVGSSLLSATVGTTLRTGGLSVDLGRPGAVLAGLNRAFPLDHTGDKFMTVWYSVYDASRRTLTYASAGHHPAVFLSPGAAPRLLGGSGPLIGFFESPTYAEETVTVDPGSLLTLFSDGGFEVGDAEGRMLGYDSFVDLIATVDRDPGFAPPRPAEARLAAIVTRVLEHAGGGLADDFAILEARFN